MKPSIKIIEVTTSDLIKTEVNLKGEAKLNTEQNCGNHFIGYEAVITDEDDISIEYFTAGPNKDAGDLLDEIAETYPEEEYDYTF